MPNLRSLSLGRNVIKKIEKLDGLAGTLEELWISYNLISSLDGLQALQKLTTLYMSNNAVKSWDERLCECVCLVGLACCVRGLVCLLWRRPLCSQTLRAACQ